MGEEVAAKTPRAGWFRRIGGCLDAASFWVFWALFGSLVRLIFRLRIENRPLLRGPVVLVANHTSYLDPLVLGSACPRRITYLMNAVIWRTPPLHWFYRWSRAIPVAPRGNNRDAVRAARSVLDRGGVLGIFPEGGISRDGKLLLGNPGAVSIGLAKGVPVIPVAIIGAARALPPHRRWPRLARITVRFGAPLEPADLLGAAAGGRKQRLGRAIARVMEAIASLSGQESRESVLMRR